ncbi:MAG TPA: ABC transporter ATP-binding protein [Candidatus Limnocylindrales bacterium]|nr:ABC transporter ATP-binding protein [Candidatus Limnocylindrales bacterium]
MIDPSPGTPEIRLTDLSKHFRDVRAVDRVSLDIRPGEFFSMLGPSGCGKTTTLRMIGGFELPTAGRIELRGRDVTTDPPDKRPVNMVFQNYALFPHLDVAGNVAFGLRRKGVDKAQIARRVGEALELVHLGGYDKRKPNQLSGGQQQRVALARALVNRPNVLLLDEPLGALDLKLRKALQIELKRVQTEVGITFVYVTHDQEEALTMSDRIAVMHRGRVEQLGTPEELYERPRTRFVADFIGTSNLLAGIVESVDGSTARVRLSSGDGCLIAAGGLASGRSIELSVRPESVRLAATNGTGSSGAGGTLLGAVEQVAYLGGNVQYLVRTAGGLTITALAPKSGERIPVGGAVDVSWSPGDALVLAEPSDGQGLVTQEEVRA